MSWTRIFKEYQKELGAIVWPTHHPLYCSWIHEKRTFDWWNFIPFLELRGLELTAMHSSIKDEAWGKENNALLKYLFDITRSRIMVVSVKFQGTPRDAARKGL